MKITVVNGTQNKGNTFQIKNMFLSALGGGHEVTEFDLPQDMPEFCTGCKACFSNGISVCPHAKYTVPIWEAVKAADLLVFTSSVYVFHVTGQMKALLDHYGTKWMAHSPEPAMFSKKAVIITNSAGKGNKNVEKDIGDSIDFWGVGRRYAISRPLFYAFWGKVSETNKAKLQKRCERVAKSVQKPAKRPRFKIRFFFKMMGVAQKMINKKLAKDGEPQTADFLYWKEHGWLDGKKPW